jgi:hypothetical protein
VLVVPIFASTYFVRPAFAVGVHVVVPQGIRARPSTPPPGQPDAGSVRLSSLPPAQACFERVLQPGQGLNDIVRRSSGLPFAFTALFLAEPPAAPKVRCTLPGLCKHSIRCSGLFEHVAALGGMMEPSHLGRLAGGLV